MALNPFTVEYCVSKILECLVTRCVKLTCSVEKLLLFINNCTFYVNISFKLRLGFSRLAMFLKI